MIYYRWFLVAYKGSEGHILVSSRLLFKTVEDCRNDWEKWEEHSTVDLPWCYGGPILVIESLE